MPRPGGFCSSGEGAGARLHPLGAQQTSRLPPRQDRHRRENLRGTWAFPPQATGPKGISGEPQPISLVRFEPQELWTERYSEPGEVVYADLYEPYLEKVS